MILLEQGSTLVRSQPTVGLYQWVSPSISMADESSAMDTAQLYGEELLSEEWHYATSEGLPLYSKSEESTSAFFSQKKGVLEEPVSNQYTS